MSLEPWKEINMARVGSYDKEFKESIIQYVLDHPDETYVSVGKRFDVPLSLFLTSLRQPSIKWCRSRLPNYILT